MKRIDPSKHVKAKRPQMRSTAELADMFGVEFDTLCLLLANTAKHGKPLSPVFRHNPTRTLPQRTYYALPEARRWWAKVGKPMHESAQ